MSPSIFTLRLTVRERSKTTAQRRPPPPSSRVQELLDEQHPQKMIDNMALIIINQTFSALLEILGPDAPQSSGDGGRIVHISVAASARHCCITLHGGGAATVEPDYMKQSSNCHQFRLARVTITASPSTLHLARIDGGGVAKRDYWSCADARPDVAGGKGLLAVVETIKARLDAAIRVETTLLRMAKNSGCRRSAKIKEVVEARAALEKMAAAVDLDAIMRRHRRRAIIQEEKIASCRPGVDQAACDAEVLATRLSALHVGKKRGCPVRQEMSCRQTEVDDAEVLTKRLKALDV